MDSAPLLSSLLPLPPAPAALISTVNSLGRARLHLNGKECEENTGNLLPLAPCTPSLSAPPPSE